MYGRKVGRLPRHTDIPEKFIDVNLSSAPKSSLFGQKGGFMYALLGPQAYFCGILDKAPYMTPQKNAVFSHGKMHGSPD